MKVFLAAFIALSFASCSTLQRDVSPHQALSNAQAAQRLWASNSQNVNAQKRYHQSVERLVEWLDQTPAEERADVCRKLGLNVVLDDTGEHGLRRFTLAKNVPMPIRFTRHTRQGMGVPVVAWRPNDGTFSLDEQRPPEGISAPVTAMFDQNVTGKWTLRFYDPTKHQTVKIRGRNESLAADFTAPVALIVGHAQVLRRSAFSGMLNSTKSKRREKLYLMQPYDPNRIPLVMIHGLQSTPVAFGSLVNDLSADPVIRARYQIWHYYYPTGTAVLQNAAKMRRLLRELRHKLDPKGADFATNHMVVIGHSMGGIISHTLVSDSNDLIWDKALKVKPEKLADSPSKSLVQDVFIFIREPRVRRAIFVAVPHRGSSMADNWIGNLGQSLFKPDLEATSVFRTLVDHYRDHIDPFLVKLVDEGKLSSIRTLSGKSPALRALAEIPPNVPFHSIIGQRGRGPLEKSSDGIVPYQSSHLEGAESELIVPYGHGAFEHPNAVIEIKRILHLHLKENGL